MLGHDIARPRARPPSTAARGTLPTYAEDVSHGGNVFGVVSASYTDLGGAPGVPALTTVDQVDDPAEAAGGRVRRRPVRHQHRADRRRRRRPAARQPRQRRLDRAQRHLQPGQHRRADVPHLRRQRDGRHGSVEVHLDAVDGPLLTTVTIAATANATTYASQTFPITDPGGAHRIYLVFRPVTGGPGNNFFNLNWVEFGGPGRERAVAGREHAARDTMRQKARSAGARSDRGRGHGRGRWRRAGRHRRPGRGVRRVRRRRPRPRPARGAAHPGRQDGHDHVHPARRARAGSASRRAPRSGVRADDGLPRRARLPRRPDRPRPAGAAAGRLAGAVRVPGRRRASSRSSSPATTRTPPTPAARRPTRRPAA